MRIEKLVNLHYFELRNALIFAYMYKKGDFFKAWKIFDYIFL